MSRNASRTRHLQIITPEEELENLRNEVGALKRTVDSKSAAVNILRTELQECQKERDKFRTLVEDETLHRSSVSSVSKKAAYSDPCRSAMLSGSEGTLAQLLSLSKEENKTLRLESTELRCKLHDAQADIKVLREEIQRLRGGESRRRSLAHTATSQLAHQEREQFISQMEILNSKCQALEGDVRGLVEEREELVRELDTASHKLHRLNHILNTVLSNTSSHHPKRLIDLDAIITENRYLQERVKQTEEERNLAKSNASKYKAALEKNRTQGSIKLGSSENLIVTPKQVGDLLRDYRGEVEGAAETDLKSLCVALVDALHQRSLALRTQRSANKVLVSRVNDLERQLASVDGSNTDNCDDANGDGTVPNFTSLGLMEGYIPPSGPIPKYSEEDIMKDPRLTQLLQSGLRKDSISVNQDVSMDEHIEEDIKSSEKKYKNDSVINSSVPNSHKEASERVGDESTNTVSKRLAEYENDRIIDVQQNHTTCSVSEKEMRKETDGTEQIKREMTEKEISYRAERDLSSRKVSEIVDKPSRKKFNKPQSNNETPPYKAKGKPLTYVNPEDDLEEIVPIDQLDLYIKEIQEKRKSSKITSTSVSEPKLLQQDASQKAEKPEINTAENRGSKDEEICALDRDKQLATNNLDVTAEDDNSSFDLDISDYDSDNDNLDLALQDWQNDFEKKLGGKMEKKKKRDRLPSLKKGSQKGPAKKEIFGFWQKENASKEATINPALQVFLDKATAEAVENLKVD
ncbi:hypothetical protein SK128_006761 [Halocaridina rubra]|uniref:Uncharacterized protein n=1 Tax=Halocaridina rubra TaxID=373956 RepID=A0AAN8X112_HALRR